MLFSKPALLFLCVFLKHQGTVEEVVGRTKQGVGGLAAQRLLLISCYRCSCVLAESAFCPAQALHCLPVSSWPAQSHTGPGTEEVWSSGRN